jgi:hypothetical protein
MSTENPTSASKMLPRGIKRIPKPDGSVAWYWVASQVSRKTAGFYPRTAPLWRGHGDPPITELQEICRRAIDLTQELEEWSTDRNRKFRFSRGRVYFVRAGNAVKIGFSRNVERRLVDLQISFPSRIELLLALRGSVVTERQLHHKFRSLRLNGEWFKFEGALADYIARQRIAPGAAS